MPDGVNAAVDPMESTGGDHPAYRDSRIPEELLQLPNRYDAVLAAS